MYRSLQQSREFLRDLLDPKKTPKVPRAIREQAYWCLRHYPSPFDYHKVSAYHKSVKDEEE